MADRMRNGGNKQDDNSNEENAKKGLINARFVRKGARKVTDQDIEKVVQRSDDIKKRFSPRGPLARFIDDGRLMVAIVKDYWTGKYRRIPFMAIGAIVFSLLYVLNPFDLIPDVLPVVGQIDDASVVSICLLLVEQELNNYRSWRALNSGK